MRYVLSILVLLLIAVAPAAAQQCPSVTIDGPTKVEVRDGDIKLKTRVENATANAELRYRWTVSAGTIKSGTDTSEVQLDIAGLGGQTVEITLETYLSDNSCKATAQHTVAIEPLVFICGMPYDRYGDIRWEEEQARLDNFAIQLINSTSTRGFIIAMAGKRTYKDEAKLRLLRARNYLVRVRHVDPARIITVDPGYDSQFSMTFHIFPEDTSVLDFSFMATIPKNKVSFTKRRPKNIVPGRP